MGIPDRWRAVDADRARDRRMPPEPLLRGRQPSGGSDRRWIQLEEHLIRYGRTVRDHAADDLRFRNHQRQLHAWMQRLARAVAGQAQSVAVIIRLSVIASAAVHVHVDSGPGMVIAMRGRMHPAAGEQHGEAEHGCDRQTESLPEQVNDGWHGRHDELTAATGKPYLPDAQGVRQATCKSLTRMN